MKGMAVLGIIVALVMIGFGIFYPVPEKYVRVDSGIDAYDYDWMKNRGAAYVGGDAYNYQVEASLKAGYLAGVLAMKAIVFAGGMLLLFLSAFSYGKANLLMRANELSYDIKRDVEEIKNICQNP